MRRYKKEDIQRAAELLEEANNSIAKTAKSNPQQAVDILMDCQKLAILVGNHLETRGEICAPIVSMLEKYCEEIYQMAANISDAGQVKKKSCLIEKQLVRLKNTIASDMPEDRKEVVFLPYKASMWDSLESVWKAAEADADTDAYVIPIPYYDKNPDGSFREFHYEGDLYPDDVPVTHYREYDFEERRPDAIYIHNPYDEANYVTSVEPFFYSKNLKKYTDCLVYIPYYATTGGMAEGQALCPAYLYADYIVIQSENHRKYFDAGLPNEKFLAFGSPKFDSAIQKCKNPPKAPEAWKDRLEGRTVYFYNTSIGGMLENTGAFLKKCAMSLIPLREERIHVSSGVRTRCWNRPSTPCAQITGHFTTL